MTMNVARTIGGVAKDGLVSALRTGVIGLVILTGCQVPGRLQGIEVSTLCPKCQTETRSAAIEDLAYETHVCSSCRTVSSLADVAPEATDRDALDRGRLHVPRQVVHVCDPCETVVGICPQCRREGEKTQPRRRWFP